MIYEFEASHESAAAEDLSQEVRAQFQYDDVEAVSLIRWEEHCTECAWPSCYRTCDLFVARNDGNCRRFLDGTTPVGGVPTLARRVARVRFKRWAALTGWGHVGLVPAQKAQRAMRMLDGIEDLAARAGKVGALVGHPGLLTRIVRRVKRRVLKGISVDGGGPPDHLVLEVFNPSPAVVRLSLVVGNTGSNGSLPPYQELLELAPGFRRHKVPFASILPHLDPAREVVLSLNPNVLEKKDEGLTLYFGMLAFAREVRRPQEAPAPARSTPKIVKVVAWDLDNTVWDGILVEDGPAGVRLKPGVREVMVELDRRGVVNSVVSKNDEEPALAQLEKFGLKDYLVFPQISWGPKSAGIRQLRKDFDVGEDTIAFIDDSPFEREEVQAANPAVRVYRHDQYLELLQREEFQSPVTSEAGKRRLFYQNQAHRKKALEAFSGDYLDFLRNSQMHLRIGACGPENVERIHELVQRTNQMNFSGNRYTRAEIAALIQDPGHQSFLMEATDRFGAYGLIGFCLVRREPIRVTDLMFSCRVQSKRVEHAFLLFLLEYYRRQSAPRVEAAFTKTDRNSQSAKVFGDLAFAVVSQEGNRTLYAFDLARPIPTNDIVAVTWQGQPWLSAGGDS